MSRLVISEANYSNYIITFLTPVAYRAVLTILSSRIGPLTTHHWNIATN